MGGSSGDLLSKSVATSALSLRFYLFWLIFWFFFFYWLHISFTPSPYALIFSEDKWTGGLAPTESHGGRLPLTVGRTHLPAAAMVVSNLDLTLALQRERERQRETERRQIGRSPLTISSNEENHGVASIAPATSAAQSLDKDDFYILPEDVPPEEAFDSSPKQRRYVIDLVLVLGSGRSGTSASSRSLQVFDFWVPNTVKASRDNPKGYFEDTEMIAFNDKVLKYLRYKYIGRETQTGSVPNTPQKFSERPYIVEALGILQRNLAVGLQQRNRSESSEEDLCLPNDGYSRRKQKEEGTNFDDCVIGRIGLKDPRMTRLLPFWRYIIDLFQHNFLSCNSSSDIPCVVLRPRFVLSIRNPAAYYESLLRASPSMAAMPESVLYHWLISYVIALYDTKPSERFLLHYGELTSKTSLIVNNLSKFFHIPLTTRIQDKRQQFVKEFIDESLNHHKNSTDDVRYLEKKYSVSGLAALYRALTGGEEQLRKLHLDQQPFDVNRLLLDFSDIQTDVLIEDTLLLKEKDKWQDSLHNFLNEWQEQKDDKLIDQNKEEDSAVKMETETQ